MTKKNYIDIKFFKGLSPTPGRNREKIGYDCEKKNTFNGIWTKPRGGGHPAIPPPSPLDPLTVVFLYQYHLLIVILAVEK